MVPRGASVHASQSHSVKEEVTSPEEQRVAPNGPGARSLKLSFKSHTNCTLFSIREATCFRAEVVVNNDLPIALQEALDSRKEKAWGGPGYPSEPWQLPDYLEKHRSKSFKPGE